MSIGKITSILLALIWLFIIYGCTSVSNSIYLPLDKIYSFDNNRSIEKQRYKMESRATTHQIDGNSSSITINLDMMVHPLQNNNQVLYEWNCLGITYQINDSSEIDIPSLKNWEYVFSEIGIDSNNQVFGIDHNKFNKLVDANGYDIDFSLKYSIYNSFIDFHGFVDLFPQPMKNGIGIQNLKCIGDTIVHEAAFTEAPTHLGDAIKSGSFFKNGEIKMSLNGISTINSKHSAIITYDSGESSFKMIMQMSPDFEIITTGSSNYFGSIYKDLKDNWVNQVTLKEFILSNTVIPAPVSSNIIASIKRDIIINRITM